jgi:saccharopine dehydrogenase-like NADP-dependent oxidoreductase
MLAMIEGSLDGRDTCYRYSVEMDGQMLTIAPITGGAAAVGVLMLGLGEIERLGVFAPEGGVDPEKFFSRMEKLGIRVKET